MKCVYWKVSAGLKCVRTSRMDSFFNLLPQVGDYDLREPIPHTWASPLYAHVSRKVISVSEILAVNFMVG